MKAIALVQGQIRDYSWTNQDVRELSEGGIIAVASVAKALDAIFLFSDLDVTKVVVLSVDGEREGNASLSAQYFSSAYLRRDLPPRTVSSVYKYQDFIDSIWNTLADQDSGMEVVVLFSPPSPSFHIIQDFLESFCSLAALFSGFPRHDWSATVDKLNSGEQLGVVIDFESMSYHRIDRPQA
ncbi:MAG: hypothetical protein A2741_02615 [Candidatus Zambryskibacteria bacterium RIFCSPHIGHO2_01_FULL_43_27]|uniref:Uncharacterized protein n=1 Tax=Candidatus Zambryskibacteria bacterium RIFCSPLOWO2_01_FULL_43_17 TaxID=1802760 RepID=A0A1G2U5M3_9BACT|nr:MAG: hypothetical protein A2741_02615 [Candidatus Zambryskibacteria bacterium RIFCSPHIGHO2_01_FULL_43_27]OHB00018.1 MAG: hypothetical protein A3E93_00525 [Candidatus Zambryskibacteria bacterium RIFCSPHIGHO2_12_FULL_43_12b]OHB04250.1 MAG: hypothetical protein A2920_00885 [Candidatus Zambryskibacteria bacterium RIFCSPLOWO2_01_FULL_43_17]